MTTKKRREQFAQAQARAREKKRLLGLSLLRLYARKELHGAIKTYAVKLGREIKKPP